MDRLLSGPRRAPRLPRTVLLASIALSVLAAAITPALAADGTFDASADVLAVSSNGTRSFLENGLGDLRFDADHQGAQLDNLRLGYRASFAEIVHLDVEAVSYADRDSNPVDLSEAFAEIRPFPRGAWRSRLRIGAFYAPISLENRLQGWRSAYSLTPSAINTWVGEELRTFGAEYDLDWLGRQRGHDWELGLGGSLYGWNESAGQLIAERGWALHDRQSTLFGSLGQRGPGPIYPERLMTDEGDGRMGYYVDGTAKYLDTLELRALHYDNRADTSRYSLTNSQFPWLTQFDSAGLRWTPWQHWSLISQWLAGRTCVYSPDEAGDFEQYCWHFDSEFLLLSWQSGAEHLSARYDRFDMHQSSPSDYTDAYTDRGHAWMLSYQHDLNRHVSCALEFLQVDSSFNGRLEIGLPPAASEREIELALRLQL
jgi:hypothetical protein